MGFSWLCNSYAVISIGLCFIPLQGERAGFPLFLLQTRLVTLNSYVNVPSISFSFFMFFVIVLLLLCFTPSIIKMFNVVPSCGQDTFT